MTTELRDMTVERHMNPRPPLPPRSEEHIDISDHLDDPIQMVVKYKRIEEAA